MQILTQQQAFDIVTLQYKANTFLDPNWLVKEPKNDYLVASMVEAGEAAEHYGWKWWKKQQQGSEQFKIELVDMLHFLVSDMLLAVNRANDFVKAYDLENKERINRLISETSIVLCRNFKTSYKEINLGFKLYRLDDVSIPRKLALFVIAQAVSMAEAARILGNIVNQCVEEKLAQDTSFVYESYCAKNILNIFRWENGYREGTYKKDWNGQEDNEYLSQVLNEAKARKVPLAMETLLELLQGQYKAVVNSPK